jgi:hypothetical protein
MVTSMTRPAGVSFAGGGVVGLLGTAGVLAVLEGREEAAVLDDAAGLSPGVAVSPPHAVTVSASAAPAAYQAPLDRVIFVTRCSLDSTI